MSGRIQAAVDRLEIRPRDVVLEIGCGHGMAVDLICRRLGSGKVVAIDRSAKMIAAAKRRNKAHVAARLAEFHVVEMTKFDPGEQRFDAILALRVGIFHREPARAHALVKRWLRPGGRMVVEFDEPCTRTIRAKPGKRPAGCHRFAHQEA